MSEENKMARLVQVGQRLIQLGSRLQELTSQRDGLNVQIKEVEEELTPLVTEHAQLIGGALPSVVARQPPNAPGPAMPERKIDNSGLVSRIEQLIARRGTDEGLSAAEIAEALHLDPVAVRQALHEIQRKGMQQTPSQTEG